MAQQFTDVQIAELKEVFNLFDKDGDGHVNVMELRQVVDEMSLNIAQREAGEMMDEVDDDRNDTVDFAEWLQYIAIQFLNLRGSDEVLKEAFEYFDRTGKGYINVEDCKKMLTILGEDLRTSDVENIVAESDLDGDGVINFEEFKGILLGR